MFTLVFLMENQCLLSGSDDYSIKLWMRNTGEIIQSFKEHTSWVRCVHVSANSSFAISTSADQTIKVWDLKERKILKTLTGHSKAVNSACFSRCGTMILSGSSDNSIKIWEAKSGNVLNDLKNKRKCEISHNSSMFLTVSKDFEIDLWDAMNLKFMKKFKGHTNNVKILAFSTYDEEIISGSDDKTIKLWSVKDGLLKTFENNFVEITSLCFSKKGDLIIVGDINGSVTLIETESGMCGIKLKIEGKSINYLAFSDDDTKILVKTNNNDLRFYEVMSWNLIENDPGVLNNFLKDEISNFQCKMTISCDETALSCENTILLEVEGLSPNDEKVIVQRGGKVLEKEKGNDFNSLLKQKEAQMPIRDERPIHNGCKCCKLI